MPSDFTGAGVVVCLECVCVCVFLYLHVWHVQALSGEVGMSHELDNVARSLYNGLIPHIWRRMAPATLKTLGNWMIHFQQRYDQYHQWVIHRG